MVLFSNYLELTRRNSTPADLEKFHLEKITISPNECITFDTTESFKYPQIELETGIPEHQTTNVRLQILHQISASDVKEPTSFEKALLKPSDVIQRIPSSEKLKKVRLKTQDWEVCKPFVDSIRGEFFHVEQPAESVKLWTKNAPEKAKRHENDILVRDQTLNKCRRLELNSPSFDQSKLAELNRSLKAVCYVSPSVVLENQQGILEARVSERTRIDFETANWIDPPSKILPRTQSIVVASKTSSENNFGSSEIVENVQFEKCDVHKLPKATIKAAIEVRRVASKTSSESNFGSSEIVENVEFEKCDVHKLPKATIKAAIEVRRVASKTPSENNFGSSEIVENVEFEKCHVYNISKATRKTAIEVHRVSNRKKRSRLADALIEPKKFEIAKSHEAEQFYRAGISLQEDSNESSNFESTDILEDGVAENIHQEEIVVQSTDDISESMLPQSRSSENEIENSANTNTRDASFSQSVEHSRRNSMDNIETVQENELKNDVSFSKNEKNSQSTDQISLETESSKLTVETLKLQVGYV